MSSSVKSPLFSFPPFICQILVVNKVHDGNYFDLNEVSNFDHIPEVVKASIFDFMLAVSGGYLLEPIVR